MMPGNQQPMGRFSRHATTGCDDATATVHATTTTTDDDAAAATTTKKPHGTAAGESHGAGRKSHDGWRNGVGKYSQQSHDAAASTRHDGNVLSRPNEPGKGRIRVENNSFESFMMLRINEHNFHSGILTSSPAVLLDSSYVGTQD